MTQATIAALVTAAHNHAADQQAGRARKAARIARIHRQTAAWAAAQRQVDQALERCLGEDLDDQSFDNLPDPPEQAALDAIRAELDAVAKEDRWPRECYFSGV